MITTLSNEEQTLNQILGNVGCLSVSQATAILSQFCNCTENQVGAIIRNMANRGYISYTTDKNYIVAGSKRQAAKFNKAVVGGMYICLDEVDDLDNLMYTCRTADSNISFLSGNQCYQTMSLSEKDLYKINLIQQKYMSDIKKVNSDKYKKSDFSIVTYFIFDSGSNEDLVLEKIEAMQLVMPHVLIFLHSNNLVEHPEYTKYSALEDE